MTAIDRRRTGLRGVGASTAGLLIAAVVAGCGGGGTTPAKFASAVSAQCSSIKADTSVAAKLKVIQKSSASAVTKDEESLALQEGFYKKLKAITPPAKDSTAEQLHDAAAAISTAIGGVESAASSDDPTALVSAGQTYKDNLQIIQGDYRSLGLSACE